MDVYNSCKFPSNLHCYNDFYIPPLKSERNCPLLRRCSVCSLSSSTCFQGCGAYPFLARHPLFLVLTFFPALELFALETRFTINFFSLPHQWAGTCIPSRCVLLFRKYLILSLSWCLLHRHGEDEQRTPLTGGRVLLILTCTDGVPCPQWGSPKCTDLISPYLTPNKGP